MPGRPFDPHPLLPYNFPTVVFRECGGGLGLSVFRTERDRNDLQPVERAEPCFCISNFMGLAFQVALPFGREFRWAGEVLPSTSVRRLGRQFVGGLFVWPEEVDGC